MTDQPGQLDADTLALVREILRRSGHEIRNALNGISVNVEVVRSRNAREGARGEVASFAERAAMDVGRASAFTTGVLALLDAILIAAAKGGLKTSGHGGASEIEVMIYGDRAPALVSGIAPIAGEIGMSVEQRGRAVILRVLPEDKSHSEE